MTCFDIRLVIALRWLVAAAVSSSAGAAAAAGFSIGFGAGADQGRVACVVSFPCDRSGSYGKLFADYRINEALSMQAVYFDAGRFKGGGTTPLGTVFGGSFKASGLGVTGGWRWPLAPSWSLDGRAGFAAVRTRFDHADAAVAGQSKTSLQPLLGLGLGYAVTPTVRLSLDHDVTRMKVHTTRGSLQMLGVAAQFSL